MALIPNQDYFYCDSSIAMTSKAMMQNITATVVSTKNYVFLIPQKTTGIFVIINTIKTHNLFAGVSVPEGVQKLIAQSNSVADLEDSLKNLLEDKEIYIYKIPDLTSFKFRGFLGKHTVRMGMGWGWTSVSPAKRADSKAFRTFHGQ